MTWSRQVEIDFTPVGNRREEQCVLNSQTQSCMHWKRMEIRVRIKRTTSPTSIDFKCARKLSSQSVVAVQFNSIVGLGQSGGDLETLTMTDWNVLGTQLLAGNMNFKWKVWCPSYLFVLSDKIHSPPSKQHLEFQSTSSLIKWLIKPSLRHSALPT